MTRLRLSFALGFAVAALCVHSAHADVRTNQKTRVQLAGMMGRVVNFFGGKAAKEGITSTVAVKGDRKATLSDSSGQIVDLAEEKIYDLDIRRKSYKVTTFAELRRRMEEAQRKAQEEAKKAQAEEKIRPPPERDPNAKEVEVDFDVKNTGERKAINGFDTQQTVMTITVREKGKKLEESGGLVLTSDMWLTPNIAAMKDVSEFDRRYAAKLAGPMLAGASAEDMAAAMAMYPMMKEAVARMAAEGTKIDGTAILTTTTIDAVKSAEQMAGEAKQAEDSKSSSANGSVGGLLGGLARRAARKPAEPEERKAQVTFMTTTNEVLKVTTEVSAADVAVPAGFKESK